MNEHAFDRITRALGAESSRRGVLGVAAALALAPSFGVGERVSSVFAATTPTAALSATALVKLLRDHAFVQKSVDALVATLAQSGIGVHQDAASPHPVVPISGVASPLRLLSWQAHNLALEISSGSGQTGAELDTLAPDQSATGVPPPSYLLAGYAGSATTPGGKLAAALLAGQNLYEPELLRFPALVPLLFASDLARETAPSHAQTRLVLLSAHPDEPISAPQNAAGICSSIQGFIDNTINAVFSALETEAANVVNPGGGLLGGIWGWIKAGLDQLKSIAKWVAQQLTAPIVRIIRSVAGVLAIAGQVVAALQPWTVRMAPSPAETRFGVDSETVAGMITARVDAGLIDAWPPDLLDCAQQAGVALPSFTPKNDPITWSVMQTPLPLVRPGDEPTLLDDHAEAVWRYVTNDESKETAKGAAQSGVLQLTARVRRPELEQLKDDFIRLLFAQLPDLIAKVLQPVLGPQINGLLSQLTGLLASDGFATVPVAYHTPKPKTPTPAAGQALGVALESGTSAGWVFKLTAHACRGPRGPWNATVVLHDPASQTFPMMWSFPSGGTTAKVDVGPFTETQQGVSVTWKWHFIISMVTDHAGAPTALRFDLSEDIIGTANVNYPMNSIFSNLGVPIPLTHNVGNACP